MKKLSYKIGILAMFGLLSLQAQKKTYKEKEEFSVKSDVEIDINARHSDIEIETWNKNKVVVEAYMVIDGTEVSEETRDELFDKWDFEAFGNSKKVTVNSKSHSKINIHSFNFDDPNYSYLNNYVTDFSLGSLGILDSLDFVIPDLPPFPEVHVVAPAPPAPPASPLPPLPELPSEFDFDAYKKDKSYLEKWKKENKDVLGENAKVKIGKNSISITSEDSSITMLNEDHYNDFSNYKEILEGVDYNEYIKMAREEYEKARKEYTKERKEHLKEMKESLKEEREHRKEMRKEIQELLKNRSKLKIKRFIKIKAPKDAKFNMNVKYGALSLPKG